MFKRAFTLVELLIVISIIGIISGIVIVQMSGAINAVNDSTKKTDLNTIKKALTIYTAETGNAYPTESGCTIGSCTNLDSALSGILPESFSNTYTYSSDGTSYSVSSILSSGYAYKYDSSTNSFETLEPTNGSCGSSSGANLTSVPSSNLCTVGTASSVSGSGPWNWTCVGTNGGETASCSANLTLDGSCGTANGSNSYIAPSTNLCSSGTASSVSGTGPWTWTCAGAYGGASPSCSTNLSVDGVCGSSNGANLSSQPSTNLCNAGTSSSVSGSGPWTWTCAGTNSGTTASCATGGVPVNGTCGSANGATFYSTPSTNLCSSGTASSVSGAYSWTCAGTNSGTTASCSAIGFGYKKTITISNSVAAQTNYQVLMTVAYNSHMNSNFSDLRFIDVSGNILSYWIESYTSSSSASVWVKIPTLALGSTTIYMLYGNTSAASVSSGANTFPVFDDFSGTLANWTTGYGTITISSGRIYMSGGNYNDANAFFRHNQTVTIDANNSYLAKFFNWAGTPSGAGYNWYCGFFNPLNGYRVWSGTPTNAFMDIVDHTSADYVQVGAYQAGTSIFSATPSNTITQSNNISVVYGAGLYKAYYGDGNLFYSSTSSSLNPGAVGTFYVGCTNYDGGAYAGSVSFDGILARKYLSTEPTASFGSEQTN